MVRKTQGINRPGKAESSSQRLTEKLLVVLFGLAAVASCTHQPTGATQAVQKMAAHNIADLRASGPSAWIKYFDRDHFQMTVNGGDVYRSYTEALKGIEMLTSEFKRVDLQWDQPVISQVGPDYAQYTATYSETMIKKSDSTARFTGSFSGLAHRTAGGWKWRIIHWTVRER